MPRRSTTHHPDAVSSMRQRAYQLIQRKIASGDLKAGVLISEIALSRELGSSRTPVREAASQLLAEGLLELSPGGGIIVAQLTRQTIIDLYELREALEAFAINRVAKEGIRPTDQERLNGVLEDTQKLLKELKQSKKKELDADQTRRFTLSDLTFHTFLIRLAANLRILKVVNETRLLIRIFSIDHRGHNYEEIERICNHHKQILQAVIERNGEQARKLLTDHIQVSARERLDRFDQWERETHLANLDLGNILDL
jgi:DNA-binding GntR family transcriptional regulator